MDWQALDARQIVHIFMKTVDPSVLSQLGQAVLEVSQNGLVQENLPFLSQIQDEGVVAADCPVLILPVGRDDDDPASVVVDLRGVLDIVVSVNAILFLEAGLYVEIFKYFTANLPLKFRIEHYFDVLDGL